MPNYSYHHAHLLSRNPAEAGQFFVHMFGASTKMTTGANGQPRCDVFLAGQVLLISTAPENARDACDGPHQQLGLDHVGLLVDDMDEAVAELAGRGAQFAVEPEAIRPNVRVAFLRGPDGVSIELVEVRAADGERDGTASSPKKK